ncbi:hypothetical protein EYF80_036472 [Liparis tanakae]|uniref:Uncharacterized protein n=1 Tax=Liparis tanakae TaxID=230148 RepID=A0A4Z2GIG7_9TELE|nr:hypothetical protein EYF80_036472 [Liparis tanakae]
MKWSRPRGRKIKRGAGGEVLDFRPLLAQAPSEAVQLPLVRAHRIQLLQPLVLVLQGPVLFHHSHLQARHSGDQLGLELRVGPLGGLQVALETLHFPLQPPGLQLGHLVPQELHVEGFALQLAVGQTPALHQSCCLLLDELLRPFQGELQPHVEPQVHSNTLHPHGLRQLLQELCKLDGSHLHTISRSWSFFSPDFFTHMLSVEPQPIALHVCGLQLGLQASEPLPQVLDLLLRQLSPLQGPEPELRLLTQLLGGLMQPGLHHRQGLKTCRRGTFSSG